MSCNGCRYVYFSTFAFAIPSLQRRAIALYTLKIQKRERKEANAEIREKFGTFQNFCSRHRKTSTASFLVPFISYIPKFKTNKM